MVIDTDASQFSRTLRNAILLPIAVILLAALIVSLIGYEFLQVIQRSDHSREVGRQILFCHESLLSMEGSLLAYQQEADPALLQVYQQGLAHVNDDFAKLRKLVSGHDLEDATDDLIQAKDSWLAHAAGTVTQMQKHRKPDVEWTRLGETLRETLNNQLSVVVQKQISVRDERLRDVTHMKHVFVLSCCVVALLLAFAVSQLVRRQFVMLASNYRHALHTVEQRHTALERSETDLEQQKEWFRVTLTSIGDGVIVTDKDSRVVFMNHEAENLTGWTSVEALLSPLDAVFNLVHEQTREKMESSVELAFRRNAVVGPSQSGVLVGRHQGAEWPVTDTAAPMRDKDGTLLGVVLVFHNVTENRQAQKAMREYSDELERKVTERTAHLQQALDQLETFSYTVSHDLRAPLRAMHGFAEAALEDYGDKLDDQGRDYMQRIKKAAERLDRLIQDLLTYTRVVRSDAPLVDVDLDRITREITENYPNLHEPAAEVEITNRLPHVWGHESALTQVIANLLGNAAKFVKPGSQPRIQVWSESKDEQKMRLWIQDNGIGVNHEDAGRIFSMFVRANEDPRYGGTGVGLAIVKKAVEAMHGNVGVEPAPAGGSRFWVELGKVSGA